MYRNTKARRRYASANSTVTYTFTCYIILTVNIDLQSTVQAIIDMLFENEHDLRKEVYKNAEVND